MIHRVTTDIKILQDGTKLSDKGTQKSPFIGAVGKDMLNISEYNIIVEKQVLATVPDFRKSLVGLIATYYTFNIQLGLSLLCFQILQLFFPKILFKFTYYSQNYSHILTIIPTKSSPF